MSGYENHYRISHCLLTSMHLNWVLEKSQCLEVVIFEFFSPQIYIYFYILWCFTLPLPQLYYRKLNLSLVSWFDIKSYPVIFGEINWCFKITLWKQMFLYRKKQNEVTIWLFQYVPYEMVEYELKFIKITIKL